MIFMRHFTDGSRRLQAGRGSPLAAGFRTDGAPIDNHRLIVAQNPISNLRCHSFLFPSLLPHLTDGSASTTISSGTDDNHLILPNQIAFIEYT